MFPNFVLLFLMNNNNEVLLLHRINTPFSNICYSLPGNKIESGNTALETLIIDVKNSLNIDIKKEDLRLIHCMYRKCNEPEFFTCIFKAGSFTGTITNNQTDRYDDLKWFAIDNLPINIVVAHKHAIEMIQKGLIYSEHGFTK